MSGEGGFVVAVEAAVVVNRAIACVRRSSGAAGPVKRLAGFGPETDDGDQHAGGVNQSVVFDAVDFFGAVETAGAGYQAML